MQKPSPQFIEKLEQELRLSYRQQFSPVPVAQSWFARFKKSMEEVSSKWLLPAMSGAFILAITVTGFWGNARQFAESPVSQISQAERSSIEASTSAASKTGSSQSFVELTNEQMAQMSHEATLI